MINNKNVYRLISMTAQDFSANNELKELYELDKDIEGAVATDFEIVTTGLGKQFMKMVFKESADGRKLHKRYKTDEILRIEEATEELIINTKSYIYHFKNAKLKNDEFKDATNLIELYLSADGDKFCGGYYYDKNGVPRELDMHVHISNNIITGRVGIYAGYHCDEFLCRYYIEEGNSIRFYSSIINEYGYETDLLIHNEGLSLINIEMADGRVYEIREGEMLYFET